jgi:hypothetical protein
MALQELLWGAGGIVVPPHAAAQSTAPIAARFHMMWLLIGTTTKQVAHTPDIRFRSSENRLPSRGRTVQLIS